VRLGASGAPGGPGRGIAAPTRGAAAAAPWTPADWGARRRAHWNAREGLTIAADHVSALDDLSGNGWDFAALGGASTQPYLDVALGADGIYFDGNDQLATSGTALPTTNGARYTVYLACVYDDDSTGSCALATATSGGSRLSQAVAGPVSGTPRVEDWISGVSFSTSSADARSTGLSIILSTIIGGGAPARMWVNGVEVTLADPNGTVLTPSGPMYLGSVGGAVYLAGYFFEGVILTGAPTAEDVANWSAFTLALIGV
jgi:hypothetical protein